MNTFKRLLQIARIILLTILAFYAGATLVLVNLSDPKFTPVTNSAATTETGWSKTALAKQD